MHDNRDYWSIQIQKWIFIELKGNALFPEQAGAAAARPGRAKITKFSFRHHGSPFKIIMAKTSTNFNINTSSCF
jgi:hypothetical protein